jgi:hypothetical protein
MAKKVYKHPDGSTTRIFTSARVNFGDLFTSAFPSGTEEVEDTPLATAIETVKEKDQTRGLGFERRLDELVRRDVEIYGQLHDLDEEFTKLESEVAMANIEVGLSGE